MHLVGFFQPRITMHGTSNVKFIDVKQTKSIYQFNNIKNKLYRTNAAIWYNKTYRLRRLRPAYINIRINGNNQQCQKILRTATKCRINQEIKFLYTKHYDLYQRPQLEFYVLLMMGAMDARNM